MLKAAKATNPRFKLLQVPDESWMRVASDIAAYLTCEECLAKAGGTLGSS